MTQTKTTNTVGGRIAAARKAAGMTQQGLAVAANCSINSVRNWEQGLSEPKVSMIRALATVLNVPVAELIGD
jgi:transcriptional regulator with XRE-family HTH domain